jgi:glycosyltransferase involved in cell wall biosynthesis
MGFSRLNKIWLERELSIWHSDQILSISHSTSKDLIDAYGKKSKDIFVAHPGVDQKIFYRNSSNEIEFKSKYLLRDFVLFVGNRNDYKNGKLLLENIKLFADLEIQVVFIGGGQPTDLEIRKARKFPGVISFLDLNDEEYVHCLNAAVCLVYPSLYEGFGLPVLEALSCGTPVVAFDNSSIPEAGGCLVTYLESNSKTSLRNALEKVCSDSWRRKIALDGPIHAQNFTWEKTADLVLEAIFKTLDGDLGSPSKGDLFAKYSEWAFLTNH